MPLSKIIMDIHTGKLFLGKQYEWIWIDLLGYACVGLGLTGLVMWMRGLANARSGARVDRSSPLCDFVTCGAKGHRASLTLGRICQYSSWVKNHLA